MRTPEEDQELAAALFNHCKEMISYRNGDPTVNIDVELDAVEELIMDEGKFISNPFE